MQAPRISFGDRVKVRDAPETLVAGIAGQIGLVYGTTTPSLIEVEVIGALQNDHAINVHFEHLNNSMWFAEQLLEFVDHSPGAEIRLDGGAKGLDASVGWLLARGGNCGGFEASMVETVVAASPNKSLQRSGSHKSARPRAAERRDRTRALACPRAKRSRGGR